MNRPKGNPLTEVNRPALNMKENVFMTRYDNQFLLSPVRDVFSPIFCKFVGEITNESNDETAFIFCRESIAVQEAFNSHM